MYKTEQLYSRRYAHESYWLDTDIVMYKTEFNTRISEIQSYWLNLLC